jgi:hypothetical protein
MSKATFQLVYDGPALASNEMAVRDLSPALMAMDVLLEEANRIVNRGRTEAALTVKASFKTGSFKIDLVATQQIVERLKDFFSGEDVRALLGAKALLGLVFGSAWSLLKWLKGRKITRLELQGSKVKVFVGDEYMEAEKAAIDLLRNYRLREALEQAVTRPLETEGIEEVAIIEEGDVVATARKSEASYFKAEEVDVLELEDTTRTTHLHLVAPSFQGGDKWRVNDGGTNFYVTINDNSFIEKVMKGEVEFGASTILKVQLREVRYTDAKGQMKKECTILHVDDIIKPAEQLEFVQPEDEQTEQQRIHIRRDPDS